MSQSDRRKWIGLLLLCMVQFMVVLDIAIVNVALPAIQTDLDFTQENLQWVISAYALVFGGFLLLGGRLADLLGRRRVFMVGLVIFTVGSLLCGLAWSETSLIAARALQGLGAATISPSALSILTTTFREGPRAQHRARRLGRGRRRRRRRRRAPRRHPRRHALVAVDLLGQRPRRHRLADRGPDPARREPRRPRVELRRARCRARHRRAQHPRARDHEGPRLGLDVRPHDRRLRRLGRRSCSASSRRSGVRRTRSSRSRSSACRR